MPGRCAGRLPVLSVGVLRGPEPSYTHRGAPYCANRRAPIPKLRGTSRQESRVDVAEVLRTGYVNSARSAGIGNQSPATYTDMKKQTRGLAVVVEQEMGVNPLEPALFVFCNRSRKILKALYWDRNGFALWQKRVMGTDRFPWPRDAEEARREIDEEKLRMLLGGVDFWSAHEELLFTHVS